MSAKIFNGFRVPTLDLGEINKLCCGFRQKLAPLVTMKEYEFLAVTAVDIIDGGRDGHDAPFVTATEQLWERQQAVLKTQQRDPRVDFEFSVAFWALDSRTMGNIRCEHDEWITLWMEMPEIESFVYYNHTDRPDEVTASDWEQRAKDWQRASSGTCFEVRLKTEPTAAFPRDILPYIPTRDFRATALAKQELSNELYQSGKFGSISNQREQFVIGRKLIEFMTTPAGMEQVAAKAREIEPLLVEVTEGTLIGNFPMRSK